MEDQAAWQWRGPTGGALPLMPLQGFLQPWEAGLRTPPSPAASVSAGVPVSLSLVTFIFPLAEVQ